MRSGMIAIVVGVGLSGACDTALAADANRLSVRAVVTETYDSNVAASDAAVAAERGISQQDSITEPSIAVDILVPVSRQSVFLKGSAGYDFYSRNSILNSGRIDLQGGANLLVRNCKGTVSAGVNYQQSDLQDLSLIATRNVNDTESVNLNGSCGGQVGFAPTLSLTQTWSNNSSPLLKPSDFRDLNATVGLAYRRPLFGELSAFFSYDDASFPNRDLFAAASPLQDGYRNYGVGVRYDRRFGARIEGDVKVAYTSVQPNDPTVRSFQGVTFGADLTFRFSRLLQAQLSLARAVSPTIRPDVTYSVQNSYGGQLNYSLGRKLTLSGGASGEVDSYRGAVILANQDITNETIWSAFVSAHYQLNRRIGFGLDVRHQRRDANLTAFSYSDDRVALSIAAGI